MVEAGSVDEETFPGVDFLKGDPNLRMMDPQRFHGKDLQGVYEQNLQHYVQM